MPKQAYLNPSRGNNLTMSQTNTPTIGVPSVEHSNVHRI